MCVCFCYWNRSYSHKTRGNDFGLFWRGLLTKQKECKRKDKNQKQNPSILGAEDITGGEVLAGGCHSRSPNWFHVPIRAESVLAAVNLTLLQWHEGDAPLIFKICRCLSDGKEFKGGSTPSRILHNSLTCTETAGSDLPCYKFSGDVGCDSYKSINSILLRIAFDCDLSLFLCRFDVCIKD